MTEIVIQADLGGMSIALTERADDADEERLNGQLDLFIKMVDRQRAKIFLREALQDLVNTRQVLASIPDRRVEMLVKRAAERARIVAQNEQVHVSAGKRSEFRMTDAQKRNLQDFDANTEVEAAKFDDERKKHESAIPAYEDRIARLRARIAGGDPAEPLEVEHAKLAEAAD